mmetsp:Transcript_89403/g.239589  ORF Transcript_89403/g.239589 Transcript_89403/m.239589 type:complete len:216 (-) Transcript_89403:1763-2410(-)
MVEPFFAPSASQHPMITPVVTPCSSDGGFRCQARCPLHTSEYIPFTMRLPQIETFWLSWHRSVGLLARRAFGAPLTAGPHMIQPSITTAIFSFLRSGEQSYMGIGAPKALGRRHALHIRIRSDWTSRALRGVPNLFDEPTPGTPGTLPHPILVTKAASLTGYACRLPREVLIHARVARSALRQALFWGSCPHWTRRLSHLPATSLVMTREHRFAL